MRNNFFRTTIEPLLSLPILELIEYLKSVGLLKDVVFCSNCNIPMLLRQYTRNKNEYALRCMTRTCINYKYKSIRNESIFERYKFSLATGIKLIWKWLFNTTAKSIKSAIYVDSKVLIDFYDDLRRCCKYYFECNPAKLGGSGVVCQIDESNFRCKPKYHRGRYPENEIWVFWNCRYIIFTFSNFVRIINDRSANTLLPIINEVCLPGTVIYSDQWRSYNRISQLGFVHSTVNHSLRFIDPETGAHTQAIESYWAKIKNRIKQRKGVLGEKLDLYLVEWMWKDNIYNENWNNVMELIRRYSR